MGGWLGRFRENIRLIRQIVRDRYFCLLPYLSSIDYDFYIRNGPGAENNFERSPHPLFDSIYYRNRYLDNSYKRHPFCHYMSVGFARGYKPGPFFDYDIYAKNANWRREHGNPLRHYLGHVRGGWPRTGIFFDLDWYLDKIPVLRHLNIDPVKHYRLQGARKGRSPTPLFDPKFYLSSTPEDPHAAADPFSHYLIYGILQDKQPCFWFEPVYYQKTYASDIGDSSPLEHYLRKGLLKGNYPTGRVEKVPSKPRISVVVPVYNAEPHLLNYCIRSVQTQEYPHWQLCLADDGSTREGLKEQLDKWVALDCRIKVIYNEKNLGISAASNAAAALADGDFIGFLDNDDELTPDCLYHVAETIARMSADVVYTDEDLIDVEGSRLSVFYKPGFNKMLLESHNYITHFVVVARALFSECKGFRSVYDGAQDFDLMLRLSDLTDKIVHIPRILYHWRAAKTSTSIDHSQKSYAHEAGKKALAVYIEKNQRNASAEDTELHYFYRLKKKLFAEPTVHVLVWSRDLQRDREHFKQIRKTTDYTRCEILLLAEPAGERRHAAEDRRSCISEGVYLEENVHFTSKTRALNDVIDTSDSDYLVFLDSSVFTVESGWLKELVSQVSCEGVGIACGRLSYLCGDGTSYTVPDLKRKGAHYYFSFLTSCSRHLNGLHCSQFIHFSPWDICIIKRKQYDSLGGFEAEMYPSLFAMTDLSLRAAQSGLKTVYTPYAAVIGEQEGSHTCACDTDGCMAEKNAFQSTWRDTLDKQDPYYNLNILDEHGIDRDSFRRWYVG